MQGVLFPDFKDLFRLELQSMVHPRTFGPTFNAWIQQTKQKLRLTARKIFLPVNRPCFRQPRPQRMLELNLPVPAKVLPVFLGEAVSRVPWTSPRTPGRSVCYRNLQMTAFGFLLVICNASTYQCLKALHTHCFSLLNSRTRIVRSRLHMLFLRARF